MNPAIRKYTALFVLLSLLPVSRAGSMPPIAGTWLSGDGDGWND